MYVDDVVLFIVYSADIYLFYKTCCAPVSKCGSLGSWVLVCTLLCLVSRFSNYLVCMRRRQLQFKMLHARARAIKRRALGGPLVLTAFIAPVARDMSINGHAPRRGWAWCFYCCCWWWWWWWWYCCCCCCSCCWCRRRRTAAAATSAAAAAATACGGAHAGNHEPQANRTLERERVDWPPLLRDLNDPVRRQRARSVPGELHQLPPPSRRHSPRCFRRSAGISRITLMQDRQHCRAQIRFL